MARTFNRSLFAAALATSVFASGCLTPQSDAVTGLIAAGAGATVTPAPTPTSGVTGDIYLKVETAWETTPDVFQTQSICKIAQGSAAPSLACPQVDIPEGQLHYSKLKITVGSTNSAVCKIIVFHPYYYLGSTAAIYTPPWAPSGPIDCSDHAGPGGGPSLADCYDGVAKQMVTSFPTYTGMYFLTSLGNEVSYTADSANTKLISTNRWTCNNNPAPAAPIADYVANSTKNYTVECRDEYYTLLKQLTLVINDVDVGANNPGGPQDDFNDWGAP
jgi:hypothetical protein